MKSTLFVAALVASVPLAGCIYVDDGREHIDDIAVNTETALRVCGGEGWVKEVTEDGFTCKEDDE